MNDNNDEGVSIFEVNRNVLELKRQVESFGMHYVPLMLWEENRKNVGERIGKIENELAERRRSFANSFLYPMTVLLCGTGVGVAAARIFGG